jgi:DNA-binding response OmpR family regulator
LNSKILIIEDDIEMQNLIVDYLEGYHFDCTAFLHPKDALNELKINDNYALVVLDLMLPDMDGFDVFKKIKQIKNIPILISSARDDIGNKIHGYELGADDFLAKPYEVRELVLRIEYILKKHSSPKILINDFTIDKDNKTLFLQDYAIDLTRIEFEIFSFLIEHKNVNISREQLINATSLDENTKYRSVDMHISNIRSKIGDDPKEPQYLKSVWGIGYKFIG